MSATTGGEWSRSRPISRRVVPLGNAQQRNTARSLDKLPHPGIDIHWSGETETLNENAIPFATALILAVMLVYIVMASLFNNLGTPFVIMFALPMALVGALGALVITGETMSLIAAIGIIMLVGLMGRNGILLLDYANTLRARGLERNEALMEAGATRLRPILMTTTATIVGHAARRAAHRQSPRSARPDGDRRDRRPARLHCPDPRSHPRPLLPLRRLDRQKTKG